MPKNETRNTKEVIMNVALEQFSKHGFEGTGVRDIAKVIGIRESAIYKHFGSKQEIFNSILKDIEHRYEKEMANLELSRNIKDTINENDSRTNLFLMCTKMFAFYLKSEYGIQLRRMLTIEQYRDSEAGNVFRELIINNGLTYITSIFQELIDAKVYIDEDPVTMATQFYSPLYLLLSKYDGQKDAYDEALSALEQHITLFNKVYARRK
ncbi:TetR/AcrR family transcriptional regulator [Breznakia pachnodae]|uniref:AcrR family transcriptional regulator n=1 Tax=Breznakia pachnodae TaxID=265178 RepID=A0ABU0E2X5_9FIRM|nr:TetR/AcrR family transcriptional regulator [Breznakia pachnodae]MDQ0361181.1 AcrR family transcriptional regulator [Breznakia pachnodae]